MIMAFLLKKNWPLNFWFYEVLKQITSHGIIRYYITDKLQPGKNG